MSDNYFEKFREEREKRKDAVRSLQELELRYAALEQDVKTWRERALLRLAEAYIKSWWGPHRGEVPKLAARLAVETLQELEEATRE